MAKNWIQKHYPVGCTVKVPCLHKTGDLEEATVTDHTLGSGFHARHTEGIVVQFGDQVHQQISAAFLDEDGEDRV